MAHEPSWARHAAARQAAPKTSAKGAGAPIACMLFVTAMGAAFWMGAVWASQSWSWIALSR
jgi:hypothetical protein